MRRLYYVHRDGPDGRGLRWTVDDPEDLEQVRRIWEQLDAPGSGPQFYEAIMRVAAEVGTRRGVLVLSTHNTCAALGEAAVERVLRVYAEAFKYVGSVLERGDDLRGPLDGPVATPAFRVRA